MIVEFCAAIAMGSNMGDRGANIRGALAALDACAGVRVGRVSTLIETLPVAPPGTPPEVTGGPYLNGAAVVQTSLSAPDLMRALLDVEGNLGRRRNSANRCAARPIDLDLLLYDGLSIAGEELTVPHPRMHERLFVLVPLAEIAADWVVPGRGEGATVAHLLAALRADGSGNGMESDR